MKIITGDHFYRIYICEHFIILQTCFSLSELFARNILKFFSDALPANSYSLAY